MKISQKKFSFKIVNIFKENGIEQTFKDDKSSTTLFYRYEEIGNNKSDFETKNSYFLNVSICMMVIGLIMLVIKLSTGKNYFSQIYLVATVIFYALYHYSKVSLVALETDNQTRDLMILKDKNYNEIENKIYRYRNNYLRKKYYYVNPKNNPDDEISKLLWLKEIGAISDDELNKLQVDLLIETTKDENTS